MPYPASLLARAASVLIACASVAQARPIAIVAAERVYGDVAEQVGGSDVTVVSVLSNPDQDPHLFEASPSVARNLSAARIVIYNGIAYDAWMERLLAAVHGQARTTIDVGALVGKAPGDNPHIWYEPDTVRAMARALAHALSKADPAHEAGYAQRLATFEQSLLPIAARIAALRSRLAGTPVTATEPVFGAVFAALGMPVRNARFQLAVMNDTEPSASDVAAFETDLKTHRVKLLVHNTQASNRIAVRMVRLAQAAGIPVVGVAETEPAGVSYQAWMLGALDAVDRALP